MSDPAAVDPGRARVRQIFTFLKALDEHRNPVKRQISDYLEQIPATDLPEHESVDLVYPVEEGTELMRAAHKEYLLRVSRPRISAPPQPPAEDFEWIREGWQDPFATVELVAEISQPSADGSETPTEGREDDEERVGRLAAWQVSRDRWAKAERPARKALQLFDRLYALHGRLEREGNDTELVFGDGILNWRLPTGGLHHPVLLQAVELRFDPHVPEFTIEETDAPVEFYTPLFREIEGLPSTLLTSLRAQVANGLSPVQGSAFSSFLRGLVASLASGGEFLEGPPPKGEMDLPRIWRAPLFFLRRRAQGFAAAIETVLANLDSGIAIPEPLSRIAGVVGAGPLPEDEASSHLSSWEEPEEVLLSRPANPEQIEVIRRLARHSSVVVQGPPGTGKTHTIANVLGHLLAQGKSVLVTSHTEKALSVLRGHVVEDLRPLCMSVLGSDIESRRQLEVAVSTIVERLSHGSLRSLDRQAEQLQGRRRDLIQSLHSVRQRILDARANEYRPVILAGDSVLPADAAREVARDREQHEWLPGPLVAAAPLPLSTAQVLRLYDTNLGLSAADEDQVRAGLPPADLLPSPVDVRDLAQSFDRCATEDRDFRSDLWDRQVDGDDRPTVERVIERAAALVAQLGHMEAWERHLVDISLSSNPQKVAPWSSLLEAISRLDAQCDASREALYRFSPRLPSTTRSDEQMQICDEVLAHLAAGHGLGFLAKLGHPQWKTFLAEASVDGRPPSVREHFEALRALASLSTARRHLLQRWTLQATKVGLPSAESLGDEPEPRLLQLRAAISRALAWPENVDILKSELRRLGFRVDEFARDRATILSDTPFLDGLINDLSERFPKILSARKASSHWAALTATRTKLNEAVRWLTAGKARAAIVRRLATGLRELTADDYEAAYADLLRLGHLQSVYTERIALIGMLEPVAPEWARAVSSRQGCHAGSTPPGDAAGAWRWRQIVQELDARARESLAELSRLTESYEAELRPTTSQLIAASTWAAQIRRTTPEAHQALIGWQDIVRRTPRTSTVPGRLARLRREAQAALQRCRTAVPVWIMPLARVMENFDFSTTRFDLAIIDEASQTDIMGLLVYALADRVLVVGDHQQVSPSAVGQQLGNVTRLIDEHLQGIPNAILYDGQTSIYDLARQSSSGGLISLLEHFRCAPEIIQFSNHLSYEGRIKPLREEGSIHLRPHWVPYRVEGPLDSRRKVNDNEAEAIASLIVASAEQPEYKGSSFGVISLVGDEQAAAIDLVLRQHLSPTELEGRRVVCGSSAQFQGDERDVMFLSVVDITEGSGPLRLRDDPKFRQRYNVAASRARDQSWVVYSLDPQADLKPNDLRRRLIEHALDPQALLRDGALLEQLVESEFERLVAVRIRQRGYTVIPQYRVGWYRIDLVVQGSINRLAIECDGDRYHPLDKLPEDMARQATLERLGWRFVRIRGSQFFRDPEAAMAPVFEAIERVGIETEDARALDSTGEVTAASELIDRVKRRAAELRRQWQQVQSEGHGYEWEEGDAPLDEDREGIALSEVASEIGSGSDGGEAEIGGVEVEQHPAAAQPSVAPEGDHRNRNEGQIALGGGVHPGRHWLRIEDVPPDVVQRAIFAAVPTDGRVQRDQVLVAVKDAMGFSYLGKKIRSRINRTIGALVRARRLETDWTEVWRPSQRNLPESDREILL